MSMEKFADIMAGNAPEPGRQAPQQQQEQAPSNNVPSLSGEMGALFREGLKDLQNAILPAFPDSLRGVDEPGTPLNPTQIMVTDSLIGEPEQGRVTTLDDILASPTPQQPEPPEHQHERGGLEM
jgi:hypothetical protein